MVDTAELDLGSYVLSCMFSDVPTKLHVFMPRWLHQQRNTKATTRDPLTVRTDFAAACVTGWHRIVPQIRMRTGCVTTLPFFGNFALTGKGSGKSSIAAGSHSGRRRGWSGWGRHLMNCLVSGRKYPNAGSELTCTCFAQRCLTTSGSCSGKASHH